MDRKGRSVEGYVLPPDGASRGAFAAVVLVSDKNRPIVSFHGTRAEAERHVQETVDRLKSGEP